MTLENEKLKNDSRLAEKLDEWNINNEFDKMLAAILKVPEEERDYTLNKTLACTYNNLKQYGNALDLLSTLKEQGLNEAGWYGLCGYAHYWKGNLDKALESFRKANKLKPEEKYYRDWLKRSRKKFLLDERKKGHLKAEPIEIKYDEETKEFIVTKGIVDLGYMGVYLHDMITVSFEKEDFFEEYEDQHWSGINKSMVDEEIGRILTQYCNKRIENLYRHLNELNNCFLAYLFDDMVGAGYHFWEQKEGIPSFLITEKMPQVAEEDLEHAIFTHDICKKMELNDYYETPNNGTVKKVDFEQLVKDCFPMIDINKLVSNIYGEYMYIDMEEAVFQCSSDDCDLGIACGACAVIKKDNSFFDWHNF